MRMVLTAHARYDRGERIKALEETLGFTNPVLEVPHDTEDRRYLLTSSGVIVVKALDSDIVITAFPATVRQAYALYKRAGKAQIAPKVYKRICKNLERHPELFEMDNPHYERIRIKHDY